MKHCKPDQVIAHKDLTMSSTVLDRWIIAVWLALVSCTTLAEELPPRMLQEPVFGLHIEVAGLKLDAMPDEVRNQCSEIADDERWTGRLWVYAIVHEADATYYVVGGYFRRRHPAPGESRYWLDTRGGVYRIAGTTCLGIGPAREVFDVRPLNETPQPILQQLAADLAARLTRAFGGPDRLRTTMQRQHIDLHRLPAELQQAFLPYLQR